MKQLPDIRQHFKPVQPTVKNTGGRVAYTELLPDTGLAAYIYCYWQLNTREPLREPFYYRVVADGCIDIFFDTRNPADNFVMGFSTAYTEFPLGNSFSYTGIRFLPAAFPLLFYINASELTNRFEHLSQVLPVLSARLPETASPEASLEELKPHLDGYFLGVLKNTRPDIDTRLLKAVDRILRAKGALPVESNLDTGISPRQLRRLFDFYIGDTPKTFSKVVRFQHMLHAGSSFFEAGYYDQAHFIKEFKTLYGLTPSKALQ